MGWERRGLVTRGLIPGPLTDLEVFVPLTYQWGFRLRFHWEQQINRLKNNWKPVQQSKSVCGACLPEWLGMRPCSVRRCDDETCMSRGGCPEEDAKRGAGEGKEWEGCASLLNFDLKLLAIKNGRQSP